MMNIKHAKIATVVDSGDGKVSSNAWNENHVLTGDPNSLLGFDSLGAAISVDPTTIAVTPVASRAALSALTMYTAPVYLTESGREGSFVWSSADNSVNVSHDSRQGIYVPPASDLTGTSGAWVRKFSGATSVKWFGAIGDGITIDGPAIVSAIAFLQYIAGNPVNTYYKASGKLSIPHGKYNCNTTTIEINHTLIIEGEGGGGFGAGGGGATMLTWADGVTGIRLQEYNTSGASTVDPSPYHLTAAYTTLRGLYLYGGYSGTESESHGIHAKTKVMLDDVHVDNFSGDALYVHTSSGAGSPTEGNSNCSRAYNCHFRNSRNGLSITGGDANAWLFLGCFFDYNRSWGVNDTSFLGNSYYGCHEDSNGITVNSATHGACVVSYNSNRYACVYNQEATASTTAPSGDTTDTANWYYISAGAVNTSNLYIPAWSNGMTLRAGGPMLLYNGNQNSVVSGNYTEGGQGPIQQTALGLVQGGSNNTGVKGGSWIRGYVGNYLRTTPLIVQGNLQQWQRNGDGFRIDGSQDSTSLANVGITLKTGVATTGSAAVNFNTSADAFMGKVSCAANFGLIADGALGVWLRYNGAETANANSTGFNIASGKNLQYAGTAVLTSGVLTAAAFPTLTGDVSNSGLATTVSKINGTALSGLATGILKNTTTTGVPSIAIAADFPTLNQSTTGSAATLTTGRTIAMTGDVAWTSPSFDGSGNVTAASTIGANLVTDAKLRQGAALTVIGRSANSTGNVADIAGTNNTVLRVSGSALGFGAVDISTAQVTGRLPLANIVQPVGLSVRGNSGTATADVADITGTADQVLRVNSAGTALGFGTIAAAALPALTGDTTSSAGSAATTVVSATGNGTDFVVASPNRLKLAGNPSLPTPASTDAYLFHSTVNGLALIGNGSSFDYTLYGSGGTALLTVAHGASTVNANFAFQAGGSILSSSATGGIGYKTGAGGAVTQATSRTTGVTLNTACGAITLFSAAGSATYNTFTVTNSAVAATDVIEVSQKSGANLYNILVTAVAAGSFNLSVSAVSGTATEAPVINFVITKGVTA